MVHLNIIFPKMNETWGHISYGVTTHVYRHETYYLVENYLSLLWWEEEKRKYKYTPEVGKKVSSLQE